MVTVFDMERNLGEKNGLFSAKTKKIPPHQKKEAFSNYSLI